MVHQVFSVLAQKNPVVHIDVQPIALTVQLHLLGAHADADLLTIG